MKYVVSSNFFSIPKGQIYPILFWGCLLIAMFSGAFAYRYLDRDFTTLDETSYKWKELEGQWVVVNYFAKWCAPCLREVPELNAFARVANTHNSRIFMVSYDPLSKQDLQTVVDEYGIEVPVVFSNDDTRLINETPRYLPATYIINPEGEVAVSLYGEQTQQTLVQAINKLKRATGRSAG